MFAGKHILWYIDILTSDAVSINATNTNMLTVHNFQPADEEF